MIKNVGVRVRRSEGDRGMDGKRKRMRMMANGLRRGDFSNISQTLNLVLDNLALLVLLLPPLQLRQQANERETFACRPVVEIGEFVVFSLCASVCVCV